MKTPPVRSDEPVFWGLFGAGGMWAALISPILVLLLALLLPIGGWPEQATDYHQLLAMAQSWPGRAFIWLAISLPLWCSMHRIHHTLHDFRCAFSASALLCYGLATLLTIVVLYGVLTL